MKRLIPITLITMIASLLTLQNQSFSQAKEISLSGNRVLPIKIFTPTRVTAGVPFEVRLEAPREIYKTCYLKWNTKIDQQSFFFDGKKAKLKVMALDSGKVVLDFECLPDARKVVFAGTIAIYARP